MRSGLGTALLRGPKEKMMFSGDAPRFTSPLRRNETDFSLTITARISSGSVGLLGFDCAASELIESTKASHATHPVLKMCWFMAFVLLQNYQPETRLQPPFASARLSNLNGFRSRPIFARRDSRKSHRKRCRQTPASE